MKFRVVQNPKWMFWARGMVFWPWVFVKYRRIYPDASSVRGKMLNQQREKENKRLFRHELQHVYQVREHGRLLFLLKYVWEWMRAGFSYQKHPMEIEARSYENVALTREEQDWFATGRIEV